MPTGYTAGVECGQVTTLEQYAMGCARAFGALVSMRDDPNDAKIPDELRPETKYYDEKIAFAKQQLREIPLMTLAQCKDAASAVFSEAHRLHEKYVKEKAIVAVRYQEMISKVEAWNPPEMLASLKTFMLQQLTESVNWDCGGVSECTEKLETAEEWRGKALTDARRDVAYWENARTKEIDRVKGRNEWLKALRGSLQTEQPVS